MKRWDMLAGCAFGFGLLAGCSGANVPTSKEDSGSVTQGLEQACQSDAECRPGQESTAPARSTVSSGAIVVQLYAHRHSQQFELSHEIGGASRTELSDYTGIQVSAP